MLVLHLLILLVNSYSMVAGLMQMIDQGEQDDKIIAVHADDPEYRDYSDISQLSSHRLKEIKRSAAVTGTATVNLQTWRAQNACVSRFFEDYKKNENKEVKVDEVSGGRRCQEGYQSLNGENLSLSLLLLLDIRV